MRFVKPKKGFRLSKNLGLLLFSTAVISGSLSSDNKAYGLEAPSLPPSVMMASAKNGETNSSNKVVKPSEKKDVKTEKALASSKEVKPVSVSAVSASSNAEKSVKEIDAVPAPVVKQNPVEEKSEELTPAAPPSLLVNSVKNQDIKQLDDEDDNADDDFSIKGDESPKPASNLIASAKIVEKDVAPVTTKASKDKTSAVKALASVEKKADVKTVEKKDVPAKAEVETPVEKKAEVKPAEKTISNNSAKKDIVKASFKASEKPVEMKKAEKTEVKEETKSEVKKHSKVRRVTKKVRVDDNECPPEWDWFSAPLVFVRDANGKLVLMADKNAPKIVIGSKKTSNDEVKVVKPVKVENKVVKTKKPVVKTVKKAEPEKVVEAKPFEAPAAPAAVVEPKPVVEEIAEVKEETPVVSYNKPVVMIEAKNEETKPLFAEASEKMARIKRLHDYDSKSDSIEMASLRRSASMVRMHKLVVELIKRTDNKKPNKDNKLMKASVAPQAPPEAANDSKIADNSSNNSGSSSEKYAFRPYYNPDFSSTIRLRAY